MRTRFATAFKNRNKFSMSHIETPELISAAQIVKLIIIKKEYVELSDKEAIGCLLATD